MQTEHHIVRQTLLCVQASIKYNEAVTQCRDLRTTIDCLRRERLVFDGIHSKLEKELQARSRLLSFCASGKPLALCTPAATPACLNMVW
jgi:hypothetical protein